MSYNWVSEFITAITYLSEKLYILSALSTLFGRYVSYIRRLRYYYYYSFPQNNIFPKATPQMAVVQVITISE